LRTKIKEITFCFSFNITLKYELLIKTDVLRDNEEGDREITIL